MAGMRSGRKQELKIVQYVRSPRPTRERSWRGRIKVRVRVGSDSALGCFAVRFSKTLFRYENVDEAR